MMTPPMSFEDKKEKEGMATTVDRPKKATVSKQELIQKYEELKKDYELLLGTQSDSNDEEDEDDIRISSDSYIKVMSLCPITLNLCTQQRGRGKTFTFNRMFEVKRILYGDLVDIMEVDRHFLEQGYFLIMNRKVVRKHGLDDLYRNILTKEKIEEIFKINESDAVNLFKSAGEKQQEFIIEMLIEKAIKNEPVDYNLIDRLSRVVGYSISEKIEEIRSYTSMRNEQVK